MTKMVSIQSIKQAISNVFSNNNRALFLAFILSLVLFLVDFPFPGNNIRFGGLDFTRISLNLIPSIATSFLILFVVIFLIIYLTKKGQITEEIRYYIIIAGEITLFIILALNNLAGVLLHIILGYFIVMSIESSTEDILKTFSFLLFLDFILYPLIEYIFPPLNGLRLAFPLYLIYTLIYSAKFAENPIFKTLSIIIIVFFVLLLLANFGLKFSLISATGQTNLEDVKNAALVYARGLTFLSEIGDSLSTSFSNLGQLFNISQYTYTGEQQESENPQGVFLKEIKAGDYIYREGMPVYVNAILEAKKIDKPFDVKVQCYTEKINEIGKNEIVYGFINKKGQTEKTFKIINGAESAIQCIFDKDVLPYGDYNIVINATFEFTTQSIKKIYLMDRERMLNDYKLLNSKGITPNKEEILNLYKITDGNNPSIFTTGPVSLAIGTENSPWDIGDDNINPRFGITINNLWEEGGKISKLKTIYLKVPETFDIIENTCTGISVESVSSTDEEKEKSLKTYKIPVSDIGNIENQLTFICLMEIDKKSLDKTPITTRYLKSQIVYDYELIEKIQLNIEKKPEVEIEDSFKDETQNN